MPDFSRSRSARPANRLLELLPEAEFARMIERAERITVPLREAVVQPAEPPRHVHFPLTNVFSTIVPLRDGSAIEVATVGNEGVTGIEVLTDRSANIYRVIQQVAGESLRVPAGILREMITENGPLRRIMERYMFTMLQQSGQTAACNLRHTVEERMSRWLLMTHDRKGQDEFYLTQEFLGIMLGVRRQSVSLTAATLQQAGLITYSRGNVTILNRDGLEQASCECYQTIRDAYEQTMRPPSP